MLKSGILILIILNTALMVPAMGQDDWCEFAQSGPDLLLEEGISWPYEHSMESAVIKVHLHRMFSTGDLGVTEAEVDVVMENLRSLYSVAGISFVVVGESDVFVTPEVYNGLPGTPSEVEIHNDALDLVIFGTDAAFSGGSADKEIGVATASGWRILYGALTHEVGHSLNLYHTFAMLFGQEAYDGSNCETCGDLVCDTPRDKGLPTLDIIDFEYCEFTPLFYEFYPAYLEHPEYSLPDIHNYMSYFISGGTTLHPEITPENFLDFNMSCWNSFTAGQFNRVFTSIENNLFGLQNYLIQPTVTYVPPLAPQTATGLQYNGTPYSTIGWNFNGDEFMDLFISISDNESVLYEGDYRQSDGTQHFSEVAASRFDGGSPQPGLRGLAAGDYDGNSHEDLFAAHATNPRLYTWNEFTDRFKNEAVATGLETWATASTAGAWGNYDKNSPLDLFVSRAANYVEEPLYYEDPLAVPTGSRLLVYAEGPDGTRAFVPAPGANLPDNLASTSASWADYDGDGDQDLFVCSPLLNGSGSHLFRNEGGNSFFDNTFELQAAGPLQYVNACSWNDMNNDGLVDLVASRYNAGPVIFYQDGNGGFQGETSESEFFEFGDSGGNPGLVVADFNGDSFWDILGLSSSETKAPVMYENLYKFNDTYGFYALPASAGLGDPGYTHGAVAYDFGGPDTSNPEPDGLPDLYFGRPVNTNKFYFKATPNAGSSADLHFVKIKLNSTNPMDNTTGIGASISVSAGGQQQIAIVDGGSMRGSQAGRTLLFGLGQYCGSVTATVNWPSGLIQTDVPVFLDQTTVIENSAIVVDDNTVVGSYTMQADGLVEWKFTWETNAPGNPALDKVEFDTGGLSPNCVPSLSEIFLGVSPDVKLSYTPKAGGGYTHVMTWENQPCVPFCNIPFYVTSGTNVQTDSSNSAKYLRVRICMSN